MAVTVNGGSVTLFINGALVAARLGQSDTLTRAQAAQSAVQSLPRSQEQGQLLASVARVLTQMKTTPETDRERLKAAHVAASGLAEFAIRQRDQLLLADARRIAAADVLHEEGRHAALMNSLPPLTCGRGACP